MKLKPQKKKIKNLKNRRKNPNQRGKVKEK